MPSDDILRFRLEKVGLKKALLKRVLHNTHEDVRSDPRNGQRMGKNGSGHFSSRPATFQRFEIGVGIRHQPWTAFFPGSFNSTWPQQPYRGVSGECNFLSFSSQLFSLRNPTVLKHQDKQALDISDLQTQFQMAVVASTME